MQGAYQPILSCDNGGWNGSAEQTLDGYRVDVARHGGVCGFVDTSNSKSSCSGVRKLRYSFWRERANEGRILKAVAVVSCREG